ncbi:uncharacterized protein LOC127730684 isoform X2 [Mytilus californianus]|nr:uncharacterized protein LOC127730684 isoform X2 [Mytilus californianus]
MQRSKNGQPISDNFKALLKGIDQMIPACLQEKIFRHVSWQRYFLERLNFKLAARITNAMRTEDEKRMMAKQVMKRIQKVRENIKAVQSKLKIVAKEQCQKSSERLNHCLHLPDIRNKLFSWTDEVLPEKDDIETIEKEVMRLVEQCIAGQIQTWLQESKNCGLSEFMAEQFKKECSIIESDCTEIDEIILGRSFSTCELGMTKARQSDRDKSSFTSISTSQKVAILATIPIWVPLSVVVGLFALPIGIGYYTVGKITNQRSVKEYRQNKQGYVKNIAEKMLDEITVQFLKEKVFGQFLNEINTQIDQFCDSTVPRRISAGEILIKGIKKDIRQPIEIRKQCILVDSDFKSAYGRVLFIYIEYFDMFKLSQSYVRKKDLPNEFEVFVNGEWKDTVVKQMKWSYSNNSDCSVLSEIQILRNIKHKNILDVLGITLATGKREHILEIYTEKCDKSLETAIFHSTKLAEPWRCIHLYLCQCLEGLTYLHEHGLIHGNVKPSNILMKDGIARLAGAGIHRPMLKGPIHGIAVIKAPDLLRSLFYGRESDVFRFGIVLWESWYRSSALNDDNESSLESYEQLSYIILEGRRPNFDGKIINKLKVLIQHCWRKDPVDRPTARNILERLQNIRKDA